jgi:4a-hydroxytetrahydrobiopterin dehydratase
VEPLSDSEIDSRLTDLGGWERDGETIAKTFELADFVGSVKFIDKLVEPAEEMGHHPDLSVSWNKVRVSITTHAAGGLTENDFQLAKRIDALPG